MSKIKRKFVENYICGFEEIELTSDITITKPDEYSRYYLDPNGSNRNVTFDGLTFVKGDTYIIHNVGTSGNVITITNSSTNISMNERYELMYNGVTWKAYKLFGNQSTSSAVTTFQHVFQHENSVSNRWLSHEGDIGISSYYTGAVIPFSSQLMAITYTNSNVTSVDVDIYKYNNGLVKLYTMEVRSYTWCVHTDLPVITFLAGDTISAKVVNQGTSANDVVVHLIYKVTDPSVGVGGGNR